MTGSCPRYGYAQRGKRYVVRVTRSADRKNHSLLMAIDNSGVQRSIVTSGPVTSNVFCEFLASLPFPSGSRVVMDNASIHWTTAARKVLDAKGYAPIRMPPYSPELNPVEMVFGIMKQRWYRADRCFDGESAVHASIRTIADGVTANAIRNCFRHVRDVGIRECVRSWSTSART